MASNYLLYILSLMYKKQNRIWIHKCTKNIYSLEKVTSHGITRADRGNQEPCENHNNVGPHKSSSGNVCRVQYPSQVLQNWV